MRFTATLFCQGSASSGCPTLTASTWSVSGAPVDDYNPHFRQCCLAQLSFYVRQTRLSSFSVSFSNLHTYSADNDELPVGHLSSENSHVHGELRILVAGRELPYLGFFGPRDVCFNDWAGELARALRTLSDADSASHVFDEGEQGQPKFEFRRAGPDVFVSVTDSPLSGQEGLPDWQGVRCGFSDFVEAIAEFLANLEKELHSLAPDQASAWWRENVAFKTPLRLDDPQSGDILDHARHPKDGRRRP